MDQGGHVPVLIHEGRIRRKQKGSSVAAGTARKLLGRNQYGRLATSYRLLSFSARDRSFELELVISASLLESIDHEHSLGGLMLCLPLLPAFEVPQLESVESSTERRRRSLRDYRIHELDVDDLMLGLSDIVRGADCCLGTICTATFRVVMSLEPEQ